MTYKKLVCVVVCDLTSHLYVCRTPHCFWLSVQETNSPAALGPNGSQVLTKQLYACKLLLFTCTTQGTITVNDIHKRDTGT